MSSDVDVSVTSNDGVSRQTPNILPRRLEPLHMKSSPSVLAPHVITSIIIRYLAERAGHRAISLVGTLRWSVREGRPQTYAARRLTKLIFRWQGIMGEVS